MTPTTSRPLVIVVDDDEPSARALGRVLHAGGFEARLHGSVDALLAVLPSGQPLCIVLDAHLGPADESVALHVSRLPASVPVILMTALDDPRVRAEGDRLGCAGYFDKTSDVEGLLNLIRSCAGAGRPIDEGPLCQSACR